MEMFATFNAEGRATGFYTPDINGSGIPAEAVPVSGDDYKIYISEQGKWIRDSRNGARIPAPVYVPTQDEIIVKLTEAMERHFDAVAHEKRYDNRLTCALRAGYPGAFQSEGLAFAVWMDACNAYAYQVMADCLNGKRAIPTPEGLLAELPAPPWP